MSLIPQPRYTVPVFIFFSLCGFYFIVVQMALSHAPDRFLAVHEASKVPLSLTHNMLPLVDKILTPLISFFVAAFGDSSSTDYPTVVNFVWSFGCAIQLPLVEAQRTGVSGTHGSRSFSLKMLAHPMIWGIFYQRLSGGWILPLWLLAFMHASTRASGAGMSRLNAESVLAGWWFGHTIPALAMLIPGQPALCKTPIWVAFPILMTVAQRTYLFIRPRILPCSSRASGYIPLQLTYLSAFVCAVLAQVHVVIIPALSAASALTPTSVVLENKALGLVHRLYTFFAPATGFRVPSPAETTAASGVVHFVQFDVLVVFAAVWTALVWDLALRRRQAYGRMPTYSWRSECTWVMTLAAALLAGALLLSPGAVTSALLMYREAQLEDNRTGMIVLHYDGDEKRRTKRQQTIDL